MPAYTETVGVASSTVNRTFDDANQLLVATDTVSGTTSFYYDGNGNLVQLLPPGISVGEAGEQLYSFDQRNLLTQYQVGAGSSVYNTIAEYLYDGSSNRLKQIDSSGASPITTTYTNDNSGLSQVLVSNDGTTTTYNLFGLDLIQQDDSSETRTLLVDGLGSARVEMVGNVVERATTFEPYGKLLVQSGSNGTVYGYTGEQYDAATSLVYLRARYYNPNLKVFMSRDPFPGWATLPASQHPYSYVHNNPVNFTDPTGAFICAGACVVVGGVIVVAAVAGSIIVINNLVHNRPALDFSGIYLPPVPTEWEKFYVLDDIWAACTTAVQGVSIEELVNELDLSEDPRIDPKRQPVDPPPQRPPRDDEKRVIRVRHYSRSINLIRSSLKIVSGDSGPFIWVEHPITTAKDEISIQSTSESFFRPLDGKGGFVEFNVDLDKWQIQSDPNIDISNSKMILAITLQGEVYMQGTDMYFPLSEPEVNPQFFDWRGNPLE